MTTVRRAPLIRAVPPTGVQRALDVLAVALALVAASTWITGGFRADALLLRLSVTSWIRVALAAAAVVVVRHLVAPHPALPISLWTLWRTWSADATTRATWPIVAWTRAAVLVLGLLAIYTFGYPQGRAPFRVAEGEVGNLPARFDAGWYLKIATTGYDYTPNRFDLQQTLVFFPAFPTAMSWMSLFLARQVVWSGVLVSVLAFAWAMRYLFRLAREQMDEERAVAAVAFLALYPFAVFFSAPYTEGLFLLALLGAWWHLRRDERWSATAFGFLAGLTRPNGCLLSVPLAWMVVAPLWRDGRLHRPPGGWLSLSDRLVAAAAPGLGMLVYSAYVYDLTGDPFMWIRLQAAWGRENIGAVAFLAGELQSLDEQGLYRYVTGDVPNFLNALAGVFVLSSLLPIARRFGAAPALLLVLNIVPSLATGGWLSVGRASSVMFPLFLWLADVVPARHRLLWGAGFAALQAFAAILFFSWRPLF